MKIFLLHLLLITLLIHSTPAWAYLSVGESGEIQKVGSNQFGIEPQILGNEGGGVNIGAFLDMPLREDVSTRFSLGAGKIDFHAGAAVKWIPFPDIDQQPAMGLKAAAWYARQSSINVWTFQIAPLFSKKFDSDAGLFIPYAAIPVNFVTSTEKSVTGTQFTLGTEFYPKDVTTMHFSSEIALNLKDSYSFISGSVVLPFDTEKGFQFRGH